ncbi:MAG: hypothetical protein NWE79_04335, partial [Candidatus Bathyarchaeota archaeon]|nr:hypothetical protein [Candidatus Bathyarchaeota archaeon]
MKEGWLLDAHVDGSSAVLWVKHEDGGIARLVDGYRPGFYAQTQVHAPQRVAEMLEEHPDVYMTRVEERFARLDADSPTPVLRIFVEEIGAYRRVVRDVENLRSVKEVYNVDLLHIQKYLHETGVAPMTKIAFRSGSGDRVVSLKQLEDELSPEPPPLTTGIIRVKGADRITGITVGGSAAKNIRGPESDMIREFQGYLEGSDPDMIVARDEDLDHIIETSERHGVELQLNRDGSRCSGEYLRDRIKLTPQAFRRYGVAG